VDLGHGGEEEAAGNAARGLNSAGAVVSVERTAARSGMGERMTEDRWTGGCQCGAVRYEFTVKPDNPCICHCRMCQKQFGNFFGSFAGSQVEDFRLTRGQLAIFESSDDAERGFCRDCGTPLTYKAKSRPRISVSIGSLDRHSEMKPQYQYGLEACEPWFAELHDLPGTRTGDGDNGEGDTAERFELIRQSNHQHPDHDTTEWPRD
jgi:hypothetical protein